MHSDMDIEELEKLSRLRLSAQEREQLLWDLQKMISFADALASQAPSLSATSCEALPLSALREDIPDSPLANELLLASAPSVQDGYITVVRVVEE